jgi:hypothetical protein
MTFTKVNKLKERNFILFIIIVVYDIIILLYIVHGKLTLYMIKN